MSSEICIFHLELEEEEQFIPECFSGSESEEDEFINTIRSTIGNGAVVIVRFNTSIKNYITLIDNISRLSPVYSKFLRPLLMCKNDDFEIFFSLVAQSIFVEVLDGIVIVKDSLISMEDFENFCSLIKEIACFMTQ